MKRTLFWMVVFGISMGYFEAAVVVDLREIFAPEGKLFPIAIEVNRLGLVELGREAFSLVMLLAVAMIAGRSVKERTGYFFLLFGVWDIFYYVFLKLTINWPASLMTWDLLFLLPVPWIGPVIAPVIVAASFIAMGVLIARMEDKGIPLWRGRLCFLGECFAGLVIVVSFCWDWRHIANGGLPRSFPWPLFAVGELLLAGLFVAFYRVSLRRFEEQQ